MAKSYAGVIRSFGEVIQALRKKLTLILGILVAGSVIGYLNVPFAMDYLTGMLGDTPLIFTSPSEGFTSQLKLAITMGIILALPFILYIIVDFIKSKSKRLMIQNTTRVILLAYGLFLAGASFAVFVMLPMAIAFLLSYSGENLVAMMSAGKYFSFVTMIALVFGITFELPMVLNMLTSAGVLRSSQLKTKRKYVILIMFIVAAILTPPDAVSQVMLAIPLLILYEISIFISSRREKSLQKKRMAADDPTNPNELSLEELQEQQKARLATVGLTEKDLIELEKDFH